MSKDIERYEEWYERNRISMLDNRALLVRTLYTMEKIMVAVSDVQAAVAQLTADTAQTLGDIQAQVTALQAQVTALQGTTAPDLQPVLDSIAALDATVKAADPAKVASA